MKRGLNHNQDKGYAVKYASDPREKILIGANFSADTRTLSGWKIERIAGSEDW